MNEPAAATAEGTLEGIDPPRRILVFGASGYIGTNLVPRLLAVGQPVRAAARTPEVLEARNWPGVELIAADALKPETLGPALRDIDTAYYLVHSMAAG
ncbi:MAG TPA: NAD(P)H-binding protein, partial [Thioalkalivibrio sp.]|nr:NAD(P)H-binding protein [Thioalkalivibrio sp.]